ncbi:MAG: alanine racemase [Marmoricola sp.]
MSETRTPPRVEIVVDLDALRHNLRQLRELMTPLPGEGGVPALMVVVKADGYGHGMHRVARAARQAGAEWLAVATLDEAVALRDGGDEGQLLCWLTVPADDFGPTLQRGVQVSAYDVEQLDRIAAAAHVLGVVAEVQLKVDTGLSRGGSSYDAWPGVVARAVELESTGRVRVTGLWSHFACSDEPEHPANNTQERVFREALVVAEAAGLRPEVRHLANSAAAVLRPSSRFDVVRLGIASYGLTPAPGVVSSAELGLRPAMTARATLALVKAIAAGEGVSYGHTFVAKQPMTVGLVPAGYGDGIPRHASNTAEVTVRGTRCPVLGRICMDQFVVDVTGVGAEPGDEVLLFGSGEGGEPLAQDWAEACGTISYEIVTRIGGRMARSWRGERANGFADGEAT